MILVWLHVVAVFMGFAAVISSDLTLFLASQVRNSESARALVNATAWIGNVGKALIITGILVGLYLVHNFGFAFGAGWLLWTYALTVLSIVLGAAAFDPLKKRVLHNAIDDAARRGVAARSRFPMIVLIINPLCWVAILWLMIAKPGL